MFLFRFSGAEKFCETKFGCYMKLVRRLLRIRQYATMALAQTKYAVSDDDWKDILSCEEFLLPIDEATSIVEVSCSAF